MQPMPSAAEKLIVALDVDSASAAERIVDELSGLGCAFKIGLQLFSAAGPQIVRRISAGHRVFLDLKFHDIPNTVAGAAVEAARSGVWMFNVHALGGREMMVRCKEALCGVSEKEGLPEPELIAVTVLTSSDVNSLREIGIECTVEEMVVKLARLTAECELDGVVASAWESPAIRSSVGRDDFLIVTPGIRPTTATVDDQKRVKTPRAAIGAGADHIVVGRPIVTAADRFSAARSIIEEIESAISETPHKPI